MKKIFLLLLLCSASVFAQNEDSGVVFPKGNFMVETSGSLGFGDITSNKYHNLSGNIAANETLLSYCLTNRLRLKTGVAWLEYSNSSLLANGDYSSLKARFFQIPLKISYSILPINQQRIHFIIGFGIYGGRNLKTQFESNTLNSDSKDKSWNFGVILDNGIEFKIGKEFGAGIYLASQGSPSNFAKNDATRLNNVNQIKFSIIFCSSK